MDAASVATTLQLELMLGPDAAQTERIP